MSPDNACHSMTCLETLQTVACVKGIQVCLEHWELLHWTKAHNNLSASETCLSAGTGSVLDARVRIFRGGLHLQVAWALAAAAHCLCSDCHEHLLASVVVFAMVQSTGLVHLTL